MKQEQKHTENSSSEIPSILSKVKLLHGDRVLWVIIPILMVISILVVYSSGVKYDTPTGNSTTANLWKHCIIILIAGIALLIAYRFNAKFYRKAAPLAYLGSLALTVAVYFIGDSTNGAARWIDFGFFMLQPSELLKLSTVIFMARQLSMKQKSITTQRLVPSFNPLSWISKPKLRKQWQIIKEGTLPVLAPIVIACAAVIYAHNSSAMLIFFIGFLMLYIGRVHWRELVKILVLVIAAAALYIGLGIGRSSTALNRLSSFGAEKEWATRVGDLSDSDKAMIAIYDGGITGMGAGRSVMRARMTHPESDYIFAVFIEEYGSIMAFVLLTMYIWIFLRAVHLFRRSGWLFGGLLILGFATMITVQAFLHIMVSLNIFPETGQNLPLISRGGSSMLCMGAVFGAILGISRQIENGTLLPPDSKEKESGATKL